MQFLITTSGTQHPERTEQQRAHDLFTILESAGVDVVDVKHLSDLRPKITGIRYEGDKPIISVTL